MYYGYARVSTINQNDTSIEVQLEFLKHQANELGESFTPKFEKASGKSVEGRDVFKSLLLSLKYGDILGVYDNSRLGRNTEDNLKIIHDLNQRGVKVQISGRFIDPINPQDELMFTIESSISTYQRKVQLDKAKAGIKKQRENGDRVLKGNTLGWDYIKKNGKVSFEINEREAKIIRYIYDLYISGSSCNEIKRILEDQVINFNGNSISVCQIRRMLSQPLYIGYYYRESHSNDKKYILTKENMDELLVKSNLYPPILDEDIWWTANKIWNQSSRRFRQKYRSSEYELSSILKCGGCGNGLAHDLIRRKDGSATHVYVCNIHKKNCKDECKKVNDSSPTKTFWCNYIETVMRFTFLYTFSCSDEISDFFNDRKDQLLSSTEEIRAEISSYENELKELDKRKNNLLTAVEEGLIEGSLIKERAMDINKQIADYQSKIDTLKKSILIQTIEIDDLLEDLTTDLIDEFVHTTISGRREIYKKYLKYVKVYRDKTEVEYMNGKKFIITNLEPRLKKLPEKKDLFVHIYYNNEHEIARLFVKEKEFEFIHYKHMYEHLDEQSKNFVKKYKDDKAERVSRLLKEIEDNNYQTN